MTTYGTFYGREATLLQSNVFKIYATDEGLFFARVTDRMVPEHQMKRAANPLLTGVAGAATSRAMLAPSERKQAEMEAKYDVMDLASPDFASAEKRNFIIAPSVDAELKLVKVTAFSKSVTEIGFLELRFNGKKRKFTLAGSATAAEVQDMITKASQKTQGSLV